MFAKNQPVIVATDFSDLGDEAVRQASAWAQDRPLIVVHAVADPTPMFAPIGAMQRYTQQLKDLRAKREIALSARVKELLPTRDATCDVLIGSPADVVLRAAAERNAALVVVGATGRGVLEQALLGTTADQVLRAADRPVLVARHSGQGPILAATDLSKPSTPSLEAGVAASRLTGRPVVALHALDIAHPVLSAIEPAVVVDDDTRDQLRMACGELLRASLERLGHDGATHVTEGPASRVITDEAKSRDASLVVVATHGRTGMARIALGSVAASVSQRAGCSVLVVRSTS